MRRPILYGLFLALCAGQSLAQSIPRLESGRPDLGGIWQANANAGVNLEAHVAAHGERPGMSVIVSEGHAGVIPYTAQAREQQQDNFARRRELDPLNHCYLPGTPRLMTMGFPFQLTQTADHIAVTSGWQQVFRLIHTTGEPSMYEGIESWMGHSRGHWEGDELVVTVNDFNDRTWLDAAGNHHSAALELTERYRMVDADTIVYEVTVTDPQVYTEPWVMRTTFERREDLDRVLEYQCQAEKEEFNGDFERDDMTWYPAPVPDGNVPFMSSSERPALPPVADTVPRLASGRPDIGGYYYADAGGANYGLEPSDGGFLLPPARGVVIDPADKLLPYQGWARAEAEDRIKPHRGYDDPTAHCFVAGIPRSHYVPAPFQIVQTPDEVVFLYERMSWRRVDLDRREHLPDHMRLWQGDSIGHWEGDTLVVDSRNFNGKAWLNEAGDVISHMATVHETYTPTGEDQLMYRATITDPIAFTRPWTMEIPLNRMDDELLEVACLEDNNDLEHLRDVRDAWREEQAALSGQFDE